MIRVQPTTANGNRLLIGSDLKDAADARREVEEWMHRNHCVLPANARHLTVFENGVVVREWVLVERVPVPVTVPPTTPDRPSTNLRAGLRRLTTPESGPTNFGPLPTLQSAV
ncbi:MAG: hypothetical protein SFU56_06830 [Capsulimonadales bacterium]|nr:hypothetical protein [Capsulimonadales bacterium]